MAGNQAQYVEETKSLEHPELNAWIGQILARQEQNTPNKKYTEREVVYLNPGIAEALLAEVVGADLGSLLQDWRELLTVARETTDPVLVLCPVQAGCH